MIDLNGRRRAEAEAKLHFLQLYTERGSHFRCKECGEWSGKSTGIYRHKKRCSTRNSVFARIFERTGKASYQCRECGNGGALQTEMWHEVECIFFRFRSGHNQHGIYSCSRDIFADEGVDLAIDYARSVSKQLQEALAEVELLKDKIDRLLFRPTHIQAFPTQRKRERSLRNSF